MRLADLKLSLNACYFAGKGILFVGELRDEGFLGYVGELLAGVLDPNDRDLIERWINSSSLGNCAVVSIKFLWG